MAKATTRKDARARQLQAASQLELAAAYDVCVLGAGASGLAAAIAAAEDGASVVVVEKHPTPGHPILATGNGRCNYTNTQLSAGAYNAPSFVDAVFGADPFAQVQSFFDGCGLVGTCEEDRLYPRSLRSTSVRDVLVSRAKRAGVALACGREVLSVQADSDEPVQLCYRELWEGGKERKLQAKCLVLALGGAAPLPDGLGLPCTVTKPVLCALAVAETWIDVLDGHRARCSAKLQRAGETIHSEAGELLFRTGGVSGIMVFNLSRFAQAGVTVVLDLLPDLDEQTLRSGAQVFAESGLSGVLDPDIAAVLLERSGGNASEALRSAKQLELCVDGLLDPQRAQVTRGGLALDSFDAQTLSARDGRPIFACGEALDVDGPCGGYNLSWAWLSGLRAGSCAAQAAKC